VITQGILFVLALPLRALAALLPTWSVVDLSGYPAWLGEHSPFSWLGWLDWYFPVTDVLIILGVILTIGVALHVVEWTLWLGTKLHIFGGSD